MGRNPVAGKIVKGTITHAIYEAMITHPNEKFTFQDIFDGLKEDYPKLTPIRVSSTLGGRFIDKGILEKDKYTRKSPAGRTLTVYLRNEKAEQPLIYDPKAKDQLGNSKPKRKYKKKTPEIPEEIDATQLGVAIIDYVKHLQDRIRNLARNSKETIGAQETQIREKERQVNVIRNEKEAMRRENESLRTKLANKNPRTFNTKEILDFKRRKAESSGIGT